MAIRGAAALHRPTVAGRMRRITGLNRTAAGVIGARKISPGTDDRIAMIRSFFRLLGLLCLAATFIFLVYDGTKSIADNMIYFTNVEDMWNRVYSRGPQDCCSSRRSSGMSAIGSGTR